MNFVLSSVLIALVLLIAAAASASSSHDSNDATSTTAIRGGLPQNHRVLVQGTTVELYLIDIEYEPDEDHPDGSSEDIWEFKLDSKSDILTHGSEWIEIVNAEHFITEKIEPGYFMTIHENMILIDNKFHLPLEALVTFSKTHPSSNSVEAQRSANEDENGNEDGGDQQRRARGLNNGLHGTHGRKLADKTGTLTTLVIRVVDKTGVGSQKSDQDGNVIKVIDSNQLKDDVFNDSASLKTQYEACSNGKLKIQPYDGTTSLGTRIQGGVYEMKLSDIVAKESDRGQLQSASFREAEKQIGSLTTEFDLVMFCMPPGTSARSDGTGSWLAYAFVGKSISFYNSQWCSSVSAQLHEVGHNLGLSHSGSEADNGSINKYADQSGMMGFSYDIDDTKMCFNPAVSSYHLLWFCL